MVTIDLTEPTASHARIAQFVEMLGKSGLARATISSIIRQTSFWHRLKRCGFDTITSVGKTVIGEFTVYYPIPDSVMVCGLELEIPPIE